MTTADIIEALQKVIGGDLPESEALRQAAMYEVCHTLGFTLELLTEEEQNRGVPGPYNDLSDLLAELTDRLGQRPMSVQEFASLLATEFELGIRVGMELGYAEVGKEERE